MSKGKFIGLIVSLVIGVAIYFSPPLEGLSVEAMRGLGVLMGGISLLVFNVFPDYATMFLVLSLWATLKIVPFRVAFATYSGTIFWLLVGAVGMGIAGQKSGLLTRIACYVMKAFPATLKGQMTALIASGLVISPLIPSTTAKAAIGAPISLSISDSMGYERKSTGAVGLFGAYYAGWLTSGSIFLSASYLSYTCVGLVQEEYRDITWMKWFIYALPWSVVFVVGTYICLLKMYRIPNEQKLDASIIDKKIAELGPMTRDEKITAVVFFVSLALWMTERMHGVSATLVSMFALFTLLATNVYGRQEFRMNMGWDTLLYIGSTVNIGTVLTHLKVDQYIVNTFGGFIGPIMGNMWLFVPVTALVIFVARFIIASNTTVMTLFIIVLVPFAPALGVHPWTVTFIVYCSINVWIAEYQNAVYLAAKAAVHNEMFDHKQAIPQNIVYLIVSLLGLWACVPWWKMLGLIP